jgi:hypothetical protein
MWKYGAPSGSTTTFNGTYKIISKHSGKALDVNGGSSATANGINVHQWEYSGGENQKWQIEEVESGFYKIVAKHSGKALDVSGGASATANGKNVQQWEYVGAENQKWAIEEVENGYYKVIAKHSGKALDVAGVSVNDGANVHQWEFGGGENQKWSLEMVASANTTTAQKPTMEQLQEESTALQVYPNPAADHITVAYHSATTQEVRIEITNLYAQRVKTQKATSKEGMNSFQIDSQQLGNGLYIISIISEGKRETKKLFIKK